MKTENGKLGSNRSNLSNLISELIPLCGLEPAPARYGLNEFNSALAYSQISVLIPLCGLEPAPARHSLSKLNSALAYSQIYSPLAHQASQVSFLHSPFISLLDLLHGLNSQYDVGFDMQFSAYLASHFQGWFRSAREVLAYSGRTYS